MIMSELKDRLLDVRKTFGLSQRQMAKRIGVTSQLISMMETGKAQLSHLTAKSMEAEFGIDHDWLMTGDGEMMVKRPNLSKAPVLSNEFMAILCFYPNIANAINKIVGMMSLADWEALNNFIERNKSELFEQEREVNGND